MLNRRCVLPFEGKRRLKGAKKSFSNEQLKYLRQFFVFVSCLMDMCAKSLKQFRIIKKQAQVNKLNWVYERLCDDGMAGFWQN